MYDTAWLEQLGQGLALLGQLGRSDAIRWRRPLGVCTADDAQSELTTRRVDHLLTWIRDHLQDDLTLAAAATHLHVTPVALSRSFKRLVGRSFTDYVNDLHIAEAQLLLRRTDHPVTHVAAASGFTTLSNFNSQFRRRIGVSPREFRRTS